MSLRSDLPVKVAIFGGSGQVGSSAAFYFRKYTSIQPVCFIRSDYSKVFFDLLGIKTEIIDTYDKKLKDKLKDFNWILDFTYPTGETAEIPRKIKKNIRQILASMGQGSNYIYMSTIMAYGMPDGEKNLKNYAFPRTTYGFIKRKAEKVVRNYGMKYSIQAYVFRLGQVHGFLQSVNSSYRQQLNDSSKIYLDAEPSDLTNTIFISSLSEAILRCINNEIKPGLYTLVSSPQWTIQELYQYYKKYYVLDNELIFIPQVNSNKSVGRIKTWLSSHIKRLRPLLETYILIRLPSLSFKIKGKYRELETKNQINRKSFSYSDFHILGKPDIPMIEMINSDMDEVFRKEKEMDEYYNTIIKSKKYAS